MSKLKNMAVFSAMLVGVMIYTSPAKSAVCFLPDDDGSCGGGDIEISDDSTSENQCADFTLSQNQRNSKEYDSDCYSCEPCTYNGRTTYKCALNSGATWYGGNLSVCCTNGEKYDSAEGKCCPAGGCAHNCPEGQSWDSSTKSCKCDNGKDANGGICCSDSEHVSDGICCPDKKHNENGECVCDSKYNTDKDGNCVLQNEQKITIVIYYKMDMSRQDSSSWLNLTFKVLSASDAKSHHVELTFNPMDGAEPTNCTISYPLTFGTNTKTKVQCGSVYSMMNTPELTNVSVDNSNVAASIRLDQLNNSTVQNDKYIIKFTRNYNQTCEELGYVTSCNSCELAYTTGYIDSNDEECFRCEAYDCNKKCSEINPLWVGEDTGCGKPTGGIGSYYTMEWIYDEAYEHIRGSDSDCGICHEKRGFLISTKSSKCYKFVSITGDGVEHKSNNEYYVPYGTEITVITQNNDPNSRYCGNAYDDLKVNNYRTYSYPRRNRTFKIDDDFIAKNGIKSSKFDRVIEFDMAIEDDVNKITYNVAINVEHNSKTMSGYEASMFDIYADMDNASDDSFMDGTLITCYFTLKNNTGVFIVTFPGYFSFDGVNHTVIKDNGEDDTGWCNSAYIVQKKSWCELDFREKIIRKNLDEFNCVQLGEDSDNTEVCIYIDDNHSDGTSNNCGTFW